MYKNMDSCPEGYDTHFLVRPKGIHPATGEKYVPTTVINIEGELYTPQDHIHPLLWTKGDSLMNGPTSCINEAELEWHELPD